MEQQKSKIQPAHKQRLGAIGLVIWKNEVEKDGNKFFTYATNVTRSYKRQDDSYAETSTFRLNDLPKVQILINKAYQWILQQPYETVGEGDKQPYEEENV